MASNTMEERLAALFARIPRAVLQTEVEVKRRQREIRSNADEIREEIRGRAAEERKFRL